MDTPQRKFGIDDDDDEDEIVSSTTKIGLRPKKVVVRHKANETPFNGNNSARTLTSEVGNLDRLRVDLSSLIDSLEKHLDPILSINNPYDDGEPEKSIDTHPSIVVAMQGLGLGHGDIIRRLESIIDRIRI